MFRKKKNKRDCFLALIPPDAKRILDLGCSDGAMGLKLKEKGMEVVGVEKDEQLCNFARNRLDKVFCSDIADLKLPYPQGYFDCLIYGDVLDCLTDPSSVLEKNKFYLRDNGYVIASMANIRYYKVIIRLVLGGTWDYVDEGILWKHHLRFFTLINIKELFSNTGFEISRIVRNISAARGFKIVDFVAFHALKDLLTYQYYVKARKSGSPALLSPRQRKVYKF
jgi:2-polyprenyl-3-methyl-5-hydroxy-6-metoxy-1,4-benzoquinol methylase